MKITLQFDTNDSKLDMVLLGKAMQAMFKNPIDRDDLVAGLESTGVECEHNIGETCPECRDHVRQQMTGDAQETVEQARQVTEVHNAHVFTKEELLTGIQDLVTRVEETGLRTRKEIVQMLLDRGVKKFQELDVEQLNQIQDELHQILVPMED